MHELKQKHQLIWVCKDAMPYFQRNWFDAQQNSNLSTPSSGKNAGRQPVSKFVVENRRFILRHYFRGGVPSYFTKDRFLFRGWYATRAYKELVLLQEMIKVGLPVPMPVAARCRLNKISYTADIIMHEIPGANSLATILAERELGVTEWAEIGKTIQRFHRLGFQHVDLNAHNILLDSNHQIHLVDFDRCKRRTYAKGWALAGLARLQRSLNKIKRKNSEFHYQQNDFKNLKNAYHE